MIISNISRNLTFVCDGTAFSGVKKIAYKVGKDVERVFGFFPKFSESLADCSDTAVIFGTVGKSLILESLEKRGKISLKEIREKREVFGFFVVDSPFPTVPFVKNIIVIAGSDKRGTIYGLFHLSEILGVSPFVDWADVMPKTLDSFEFTQEHNFISHEPSVKYRGFFINDEWPAFGNWSIKRFGGANSECYEHVFELLLRLKGNYFWPAMWSAVFSWDGPGLKNAELADELGVVMGTSHHEPCCRAGEEHKKYRETTGEYGSEWNFQHNREGITKFWRDGLKRNGKFENIITIGMRGEADTAILGRAATLEDNINLLKDVISTQYKLIKEELNEDLTKVARMLVMFSEVDKFYFGNETTKGLKDCDILDDVTIMMTDDNFGVLRALPDDSMRNHKGGLGLYYHFDFHGGPHSYEWVNSNWLPKVEEQLSMAYEWGIRDVWIVNAGDIGLVEYPLNYFMDFAYDAKNFASIKNTNGVKKWSENWIKKQFSPYFDSNDLAKIENIIQSYTYLNNRCKPEVMNSSTYDAFHFGESSEVLEISEKIIQDANYLKSRCPQKSEAAFWQFVYYPAVGSANVQRLWITSALNHEFAKQNRIQANIYAQKVESYLNFDSELTNEYHKIANGKFYGMGLSEHIGFTTWNDENCKFPVIEKVLPSNKPRLIVNPCDRDENIVATGYSKNCIEIDAFLNQSCNEFCVDLATSSNKISYTIKTDSDWLELSHTDGSTEICDKLVVKINRSKIPYTTFEKSQILTGTVFIDTNFSHAKLNFLAQNINYKAETSEIAKQIEFISKPIFAESQNYISIEASHFAKKFDFNDFSFTELKGYGRTLSGIKVLPSFHKNFDLNEGFPFVEYNFIAQTEGEYNIDFYFSPTNPPAIDNVMEYAFAINDESFCVKNIFNKQTFVTYFSEEWAEGADKNIHVRRQIIHCKKGINVLKFAALTPTVILEKLVLSRKNLPKSYLGPKESFKIE